MLLIDYNNNQDINLAGDAGISFKGWLSIRINTYNFQL